MDSDLLLVAKDDELGRKLQDLDLVARKRARNKKEDLVWKRFTYTKTGYLIPKHNMIKASEISLKKMGIKEY